MSEWGGSTDCHSAKHQETIILWLPSFLKKNDRFWSVRRQKFLIYYYSASLRGRHQYETEAIKSLLWDWSAYQSIFKDYTMELHYTNCTSLHAKHFLLRCKCCLSRCYNCASCEPSACWAPLFFWQACQWVLGWATHLCGTAVLTCRHKLDLERDRFMVIKLPAVASCCVSTMKIT